MPKLMAGGGGGAERESNLERTGELLGKTKKIKAKILAKRSGGKKKTKKI